VVVLHKVGGGAVVDFDHQNNFEIMVVRGCDRDSVTVTMIYRYTHMHIHRACDRGGYAGSFYVFGNDMGPPPDHLATPQSSHMNCISLRMHAHSLFWYSHAS
jgi:hypothetical protein